MHSLNHWKRFGWLYAVCSVAVVWLAAMAAMSRFPDLDEDTVRAAVEWMDQEVQSIYGEYRLEEFQEIERRLDANGAFGSDIRIRRIVSLPRYVGWAKALEPDFQAIEKAYEPLLEPWERLARNSIHRQSFLKHFYREEDRENAEPKPRADGPGTYSGPPPPNYLNYRTLTRLRRAFAERAIANQDWNAALENLERSAHATDPIRTSYLTGHYSAHANRIDAYRGYQSLLSADPPPETLRAALQTLVDLRRTDPRTDLWVLAAEWSFRSSYLRPLRNVSGTTATDRTRTQVADRVGLSVAMRSAINRRAEFSSPSLRRWAESTIVRFSDDSDTSYFAGSSFLRAPGSWTWTWTPTGIRWLSRVIDNEPSSLEGHIIPAKIREGLDPWTLALVLPVQTLPSHMKSAVRVHGRYGQTRGRLVEAALAARLYLQEHDRWPEKIEDIIPDIMPLMQTEGAPEARPSSPRLQGPDGPYVPFQIAEVEINDELKHELWRQVLPRIVWKKKMNPAELNEKEFSWPQSNNPGKAGLTIMLAWAEQLRAHPRLATDVEVSMQRGSSQPGPWLPLEPDFARRVTDRQDLSYFRSAYNSGRSTLPPDMSEADLSHPANQGTYPPARVRLRAKFQSPEKAMVIWSVGPDGVDDRALTVYDPTNGSVSQGDLVIFPEGF